MVMLRRDGAVIHEALRAALPDREPRRYLYDLIAEYPLRSSKSMRPVLCLAACRAFGGRSRGAIDVAVAIELLHNAFLVHDDIEDGSYRRRGEPTLHVTHGVALALNAGDGLVALAFDVLARAIGTMPSGVGRQVLAEFAHLMRSTVEGQAMELGWLAEDRFDLSEADYLAMVRDKTCWYSTTHPLRLGAIVGSRGAADPDTLNAFGFFLGAVFQIDDDISNLISNDGGYDKDLGGDIIEGKRTLMLTHLMRTANPADRAAVAACVGASGRGGRDERVDTVVALMRAYGSIDYGQVVKDALTGAAVAELERVFPGRGDDPDVRFLLALALGLGRGTGVGADLTEDSAILDECT